MSTEKELLTQDLSKQEKPEDIKKFIEDAEIMGGHEDIVELAKAKYETALGKITPTVETTKNEKMQVENLGGTESGLQEVTTPIDEKIAKKDEEIQDVQTETEKRIGEVKEGGEIDAVLNNLSSMEDINKMDIKDSRVLNSLWLFNAGQHYRGTRDNSKNIKHDERSLQSTDEALARQVLTLNEQDAVKVLETLKRLKDISDEDIENGLRKAIALNDEELKNIANELRNDPYYLHKPQNRNKSLEWHSQLRELSKIAKTALGKDNFVDIKSKEKDFKEVRQLQAK